MLPAITLLVSALLPAVLAQYGYDSGPDTTTKAASASATPTSSASKGVHVVEVGEGAIKYDPDTLTVPVGDSVEFHFYPQNHSVAQSSFELPCMPINNSQPLWSGFQPVASGSVGSQSWTIKINDTKPIWLYCAQVTHCQSGMALVINPPSNQNIAAYRSAASNVTGSVAPANIQGGVFGPLSASTPSSSSSAPKPSQTGAGIRSVALGDAGRFILAIGVLAATYML